jgi:hypothetical protein
MEGLFPVRVLALAITCGILMNELIPTVPSWQLRQRLLATAVAAVAPPRSAMLVLKVLKVGLL